MKKMLEHTPHVSAYRNDRFILVESLFGCAGPAIDPDAPKHFFALEPDDDELGQAVISALSLSRQVAEDEVAVLFDYKTIQEQYGRRVSHMLARYGYKTKRDLFKGMMSVWVDKKDESLVFMPTRHEELDGWGREKGDGIEDVVIPVCSTPTKIGAALRIAFSRCL